MRSPDPLDLTIRLATQLASRPTTRPETRPETRPAIWPAIWPPLRPATEPAPAAMGPLTGRVAEPRTGVPGLSTAPSDQPWSVPLLITPEAEAWLLGWPAGLVTPAHGHGGDTVAVTVVEGALSEECLDPTIWITGRRTTWRAGASTLFPSGHVHLLGAAGDRPAVAVHAWSGLAGSADRVAGRLALARGGAVA